MCNSMWEDDELGILDLDYELDEELEDIKLQYREALQNTVDNIEE